MQGRSSGTPGNVKATDYIAAEARRLGLEPAGEDGGWFQTVPMVRRTLGPDAGLTVAGTTFKAWDDLVPRDQGKGTRSMEGATAIYGGTWDKDLIPPEQAQGKLVVVAFPPANGVPAGTVNRAQTTARFSTAAGIVIATLDDRSGDRRLEPAGHRRVQLAGGDGPDDAGVLVRHATGWSRRCWARRRPRSSRGRRAGRCPGRSPSPTRRSAEPARNVVAILRGSDPALQGELVAIGAHNDHDGICPETLDHDSLRAFNRLMRPEGANSTPGEPTAEQSARIKAILDSLRRVRPARRDSIFNGADDDGSGTVAVLEIAEYFAKAKARPRRSILFVWHTGEEMGLLGSNWFTRHPTVPRDSIVAQLNIDMVGRGGAADIENGGPGYLQLIGSRRLSTELGDLVERVNAEGKHGFTFDYQ